jgi:hypothetical protein
MKNFWNLRRANFSFRSINFITLFLLFSVLFASISCKKDMSSIGLNIKDRDDLLNAVFTDTATLIAYSVLEDSLNTTGLVFNFLGFVKDEIFGSTTASIYTQLYPSGNNVNFGDAPQLDSIVLTLRYTGAFFGDTLNPFAIQVYELDEEISATDTFFSNSSLAHKGINLTYVPNFVLYPTPNTKVRLDTVYDAHLRIRLDDALGHHFLQNASEMSTPAAFKSFFKGLFICAEPSRNNGSLVNFTLNNALSGIQLYYKDNDEAKRFSFVINRNQDAVRFSNYQLNHELGDPRFVRQVLEKDTVLGKEKLYVQSMGGVKTKILFPHLKALKDKRIVINKAELVITNIGDNLEIYPLPRQLGLQGVNRNGTVVRLPDDVDASYFGGTLNKEEYRFRITRYVQDIILRDNFQPYIYLVINGAAANAQRLLLSGTHPDDINTRLRLEIYYTEY